MYHQFIGSLPSDFNVPQDTWQLPCNSPIRWRHLFCAKLNLFDPQSEVNVCLICKIVQPSKHYHLNPVRLTLGWRLPWLGGCWWHLARDTLESLPWSLTCYWKTGLHTAYDLAWYDSLIIEAWMPVNNETYSKAVRKLVFLTYLPQFLTCNLIDIRLQRSPRCSC